MITRETAELLRFYRWYQRGHFPVKGGLLDQSAIFLQGVEIIERELSDGQ